MAGGEALAGEVGRERVEPVVWAAAAIAWWSRVQVSVGLPLRVAVVIRDQLFDVGVEDPRDSGVDLFAGLVVAAAEPVVDALQLLLGLGQRTLAGGGDLALLLGGVDVGDAQAAGLAGLGIGQLPVCERAAVAGAQLRREALLALGDVAHRAAARGPTSVRNRSRNPVWARSGTMN